MINVTYGNNVYNGHYGQKAWVTNWKSRGVNENLICVCKRPTMRWSFLYVDVLREKSGESDD